MPPTDEELDGGLMDAADIDIEAWNRENPHFEPDVVEADPDPKDVHDANKEADA